MMVKSVLKFLDPDSDPDDFQNFIVTSLSKDTSLEKFHKHPIINFYVKFLITDRRRVKHILLGGGNNEILIIFNYTSQ